MPSRGSVFVGPVQVGALAVAVEDHDELCRCVEGIDGVGRHGGELGCFADVDDDLPLSAGEATQDGDEEYA